MKIFSYLLILLFSCQLLGQDNNRYSEADVKLQAQFIRATQKKLLRKYDDALEIYESILKEDMHNATALYDMSRIYLAMDNEEKAIEYAEKAIKKDSKNQWFKESLAEIHMNFEHFEDAAELFAELINTQKENERFYLNAIDAYTALNNNSGALMVYQKMEENLGASAYTSEQIVGLYISSDQHENAILKSQELINRYPNDPYFLALSAELEKDFGSKKKAEKLFKRVILLDPENSRALVYLAQLENGGNSEIENIQRIAINGNVDIDAKIKALIPLAQNITPESTDKESIVAIAKAIVEIHPEEAKAHAILGDILKNSGEQVSAIASYTASLKYDKSVFAIWQELMYLQYEAEEYQSLSSTSLDAMDFYPNQAAPYAFHGLAQVNTGNTVEAKEMLIEAQIISTNDKMIKAITRLLEVSVSVAEEGFELKVMSKEDAFMKGIKINDDNVIYQRADGHYVVKIKKGS